MPRQTMIFQGFQQGEYGLLPSWEVGFRLLRTRLIYAGWFTARNVVRYIGGAIGPRHEAALLTVTSPPAAPGVKIFGLCDPTGVGGFWALADGGSALTVHQAGSYATPVTLTAIGTLATYTAGTLVSNYASLLLGTVTYLASSVDKVYKIDHVAATVAAVAGSPKGRAICQYGDRTIVAGPDTLGITPHANQNRLYYSAPNDPSDWSGTWSGGPGAGLNYIDVGSSSTPITGVYMLRSDLIITKSNEWWVVTGVPGVNDTLRRLLIAPAPFAHREASPIAGGDAVAFIETNSPDSLAIPCEFSGSLITSRRELAISSAAGAASIHRLRRGGDWLLHTATAFMLKRDGVWTRHDTSGLSMSQFAAVDLARDVYVSPKSDLTGVYVLLPYADAPNDSGAYIGASPVATCTFTLPEFAVFGDGEVSVRGVFVDFLTYSGMPAGNNTFNVAVTSRRRLGGDDLLVDTKSFSDPQPAATKRVKRFFGFKESFGGGWQVGFDTVRGVAIERIEVVYDQRPAQAA